MIRFLLRALGVLCLAAAFVAVVVDGTRSIAAREVVVSDLAASAGQISPAGLQAIQTSVGTSPSAFGGLFAWVLSQPTVAVFGLLGVVLLLLGRRRHRRHVGFAT